MSNKLEPSSILALMSLTALCLVAVYHVSYRRTAQRLAKLRAPPKVAENAPKVVSITPPEVQTIVFHPWWRDVTPLPLRAYDFSKGNIEGRLVLHGEETIKRLVLLWKKDRHKAIRLEPIQATDIEQAIKLSLEEAEALAQKVFGKKDKGKTAAEPAKQVPVTQTPVLTAPVLPAVAAVPQNKPLPPIEAPVIKGFKRDWKGVLLDAGIKSHASNGPGGEASSYKSYTVNLNVNGEKVSVKGNDLRRALDDAGAQPGDSIHLIHVRSEELPDNKTRHVYACSVLKPRAALH